MGKTMRAEIITIGDELLIGQVVDTNSAYIAQQLNEHGVELYEILSVHDEATHIKQALDRAFQQADVIITTGGLGPTKDDITKQVLCDYFHTTLIPNAEVEQFIRQRYASRPEVLNKLTATQWLVPQNATILPNRVGTAPIMQWTVNGKMLFCMPGVPSEMKIAMQEQVLPRLHSDQQIFHRHIEVHDIPESALAIALEDFENNLPQGMHLAYLPTPEKHLIRLRLSSYGSCTEQQVNDQFKKILKNLQDSHIIYTFVR